MYWLVRKRTEPLFLFLHIPKCAGTTLVKSFARLGSKRHVTLPYSAQSKHEAIGQIHAELGERGSSTDRLVAISGHAVFCGLHEISLRPAHYITVLRHPQSRYISHYQYLVDCAGNENHSIYHNAKSLVMRSGKPLTLEQFAEQGLARNMMTRHLAATSWDGDFTMRKNTQCDREELLDLAIAGLRAMDLIGLVEEFPEDLNRICSLVRVPVARIANRSVTRVDPAQITPRVKKLIADNNRLDMQLYEVAVQLRSERLSKAAAA